MTDNPLRWGETIPVACKRPHWLSGDATHVQPFGSQGWEPPTLACHVYWPNTFAIRLSHLHPFYRTPVDAAVRDPLVVTPAEARAALFSAVPGAYIAFSADDAAKAITAIVRDRNAELIAKCERLEAMNREAADNLAALAEQLRASR